MQVLDEAAQEASASVDEKILQIVDTALANCAHRDLMSTSEFVDVLLDIRQNILSTGDQNDKSEADERAAAVAQ